MAAPSHEWVSSRWRLATYGENSNPWYVGLFSEVRKQYGEIVYKQLVDYQLVLEEYKNKLKAVKEQKKAENNGVLPDDWDKDIEKLVVDPRAKEMFDMLSVRLKQNNYFYSF